MTLSSSWHHNPILSVEACFDRTDRTASSRWRREASRIEFLQEDVQLKTSKQGIQHTVSHLCCSSLHAVSFPLRRLTERPTSSFVYLGKWDVLTGWLPIDSTHSWEFPPWLFFSNALLGTVRYSIVRVIRRSRPHRRGVVASVTKSRHCTWRQNTWQNNYRSKLALHKNKKGKERMPYVMLKVRKQYGSQNLNTIPFNGVKLNWI